MVQIFVYTKVHVKWGLTNMSNNHFTTKTIWTLSRCYFATSNKFFHNPNSAMHFYSNPRAKSCIYKDESLNKSSFYLTLILV